MNSSRQAQRRGTWLIPAALAGLFATVAAPSSAEAGTCRFLSIDYITYSGTAGYDLDFYWDTTTGAVLNSGSQFTSWRNPSNATVMPVWTANPGSVGVGFSPVGASQKPFTLNFNPGAGPNPVVLTGTIATGSAQPGGPVVFSGIYYGSGQAWIAGYGTVTCW